MTLRYDDFEVVGFNGAPLVECGRALPVVRRRSDQKHCVLRLPSADAPLAWFSEAESAAHARAKRWTMLDKPLNPPRSCAPGAGRQLTSQPMIVFVDEGLLDTADRVPRPDHWMDEYLIWRCLDGYPDSFRAACLSAEAVEALLEDWAQGLLRRFDAMFRIGQDRPYLKRIADFALCAARTRASRWKAYVRYALSQEPDHVRRTFDSFTQRGFPNVSWEDFVGELKSLSDVLAAVPLSRPEPAASPSRATAAPKVRGMAAVRPDDGREPIHA
jgi:hypothetical protein